MMETIITTTTEVNMLVTVLVMMLVCISVHHLSLRTHPEGGGDGVELLEHLARGIGGAGGSWEAVIPLLIITPELVEGNY